VGSAEEFAEFAAAASPRLRRMAFLLCGDWHSAEDLVQTTLAKMFVSWRKIRRREAEHAYASRTLVNTYLADKRLKRNQEILTSNVPEREIQLPSPETDCRAQRAGHAPAQGPGRGGAALLGRPERRPGGGHAGLLAGQREEPERAGPGQTPDLVGRHRNRIRFTWSLAGRTARGEGYLTWTRQRYAGCSTMP
jgi:hypothetical protein